MELQDEDKSKYVATLKALQSKVETKLPRKIYTAIETLACQTECFLTNNEKHAINYYCAYPEPIIGLPKNCPRITPEGEQLASDIEAVAKYVGSIKVEQERLVPPKGKEEKDLFLNNEVDFDFFIFPFPDLDLREEIYKTIQLYVLKGHMKLDCEVDDGGDYLVPPEEEQDYLVDPEDYQPIIDADMTAAEKREEISSNKKDYMAELRKQTQGLEKKRKEKAAQGEKIKQIIEGRRKKIKEIESVIDAARKTPVFVPPKEYTEVIFSNQVKTRNEYIEQIEAENLKARQQAAEFDKKAQKLFKIKSGKNQDDEDTKEKQETGCLTKLLAWIFGIFFLIIAVITYVSSRN